MKQQKLKPIRLLLKWAGKNRVYLILSVICAFISGVFTIGLYIGIYRIIDALLLKNLTKEIITQSAVLITSTVIIGHVFLAASGILSHKGAYGALFKVRCMVTEHLAKVPLGSLGERRTGDIKTVLNENIEKMELCLAHNIPEFVSYATGPVIIFVYLMTINVNLALISLIPLIIAAIIMCMCFGFMSKIMGRANASLSNFNSVIIEYIGGMRLIKAYNMSGRSFRRFSDAVNEESSIWNEISRKTAPLFAAFIIALELGVVLIVPIGGRLFMHGSITSSVFLLFAYVGSLYLTELLPLQQLGMQLAQALNGVGKVKEILDIPVFEGKAVFPEKHDIDIHGVSFSYNGENEVLHNCNMRIKEGETVAMVGASGAGKSTIVQLISRFYDVNDGEIKIGGINVKDIGYEQLLKNVSIVFQKTFLTSDSVLENIRMGSDATLEEVREAAKYAQIDDFIMSLPDGYNTNVGSFGTRFSGGEKQRIAIARAILKNSPILILDEATSAADPENQAEIDKAIQNLCRGKTVIIVAHRLGIIKMCDKVAVVENRTVTGFGTHEELLASNSYYKQAWDKFNAARAMVFSQKGEENVT